MFHESDRGGRNATGSVLQRKISRQCNLRAALVVLAAVLPAAGAFGGPTERQLALLAANCLQCHAAPATGAPQLGQDADWQDARARGEDGMLANVIHGIRGMPPLGYCGACSEADFRALIRLLAGESAEAGATP